VARDRPDESSAVPGTTDGVTRRSSMEQVIQVCGSLLILAAFIQAQRGRLFPDSRCYLVLNLVGSIILACLAAVEAQLGFLLLEFSWSVVSAHSLVRTWRPETP
jgi:hypothetical protein